MDLEAYSLLILFIAMVLVVGAGAVNNAKNDREQTRANREAETAERRRMAGETRSIRGARR